MGKLLKFPVLKQVTPTRAEMVEKVAILLMKHISNVFIEQKFEQTNQAIWFREIRDYLWKEEIKLDEGMAFRKSDLSRWKHYWRDQVLRYIESKIIR